MHVEQKRDATDATSHQSPLFGGDHGQSRGNSKHALARGPIGPHIHTKDPSRWHSCSRKMMPLCADILISYINGVHVR